MPAGVHYSPLVVPQVMSEDAEAIITSATAGVPGITGGNEDAHTVDRNGPHWSNAGLCLFVNDDESTTRQVNRLINTRYRDLDPVDAEDGYHHTTLANRSFRCTRALGTRRVSCVGLNFK